MLTQSFNLSFRYDVYEEPKWVWKIDFFSSFAVNFIFFSSFSCFFLGHFYVGCGTMDLHSWWNGQAIRLVMLCYAMLCLCVYVHANKTGYIDMAFLSFFHFTSLLTSLKFVKRKNEIYRPPLRSDALCKIYIHLSHFFRRWQQRQQQRPRRLSTVFQFTLWSLLTLVSFLSGISYNTNSISTYFLTREREIDKQKEVVFYAYNNIDHDATDSEYIYPYTEWLLLSISHGKRFHFIIPRKKYYMLMFTHTHTHFVGAPSSVVKFVTR